MVGIIIGSLVGGLVLGVIAGFFINRYINLNAIKQGKKSAQDIINEALAKAQETTAKANQESKDILLEAKEKVVKDREFFEKEIKALQSDMKSEREELKKDRNDQKSREANLNKREETLDKKEEQIDKKITDLELIKQKLQDEEKALEQKVVETQKVLDIKTAEIEQSHQKVLEAIEKAAQMTKEQAKAQLIQAIEEEAKRDAVKFVQKIELEAKEEADQKAREIVVAAVQRCAVDHSAEAVVSTVSLPSDELKGRIIGREGRNIRALENATGIDFIIDDTPEVIVLSGFDPVRREVARLAVEKMISDGRIHPTRIEELVEKTRKELDIIIKKAGEDAVHETGIFGMHPEMIKLIGRLKYRTSYGQNILKHSIECAHIAGIIATEVGADVNISKRGALLHDLGKGMDHETEGTHVSIGVELSRKYKESEAVIHCIEAHHNDVEFHSLEAIIVQVADAISGARPGARRDSLDNYVKRLTKLEEIASSHKGVEKSFAIQAGREVRIIVKPDEVDDASTLFIAKEIAKQIESEMQYPGQIKVNVIRELRSVEYAK